jgi:CheY-like chemotaxis protein/nitrogen-specific signal transduction histidine kinase
MPNIQELTELDGGIADDTLQAAKIEALAQMSGVIAHELNNALVSILGNLQSLGDKTRSWRDAPPQIGRALERARLGAARVSALAGSLQAAAGRQHLNPARLPTAEFISKFSQRLSGWLGDTIQARMTMGEGLWDIEADAAQLEIAMQNLITNAVEAMPSGGTLEIAASNAVIQRTSDRDAAVGPGQYVWLTVSDTGTGMSREAQRRAFEMFYSTKAGAQRLGLGLSQVLSFAKASGGGAKLVSQLGKGTRVELYLPALAAPAIGLEPKTRSDPKGVAILVVEDDDDVREYVVEALQELGHHVVAAHDAEQGLHHIELGKPHFDVLLSDANLPGMDGYELVRRARLRRPSLGVILMSGSLDGDLDSRCPGSRVEFLAKPMTKSALHERISRLMARQE